MSSGLNPITPDQLGKLRVLGAGVDPNAQPPDSPGLPPMDPQTAQYFADLHNSAVSQQQQADQAQQNLQDAGNQPLPQMNPWAQLAGGLLPNLASIISQNPNYAKQGQQQVQQNESDLMDQRTQNLTRLSKIYSEKADAARQIGNKELEQQFLEKKDRADNQTKQMLGDIKALIASGHDVTNTAIATAHNASQESIATGRNQTALAQERLRGGWHLGVADKALQGKLATAGMGNNPGDMSKIDSLIDKQGMITLPTGEKVFDMTTFAKAPKGLQLYAMTRANDQGSRVLQPDQANQLREIQAARGQLDTQFAKIAPQLANDWMARAAQYPGKKLGEVLQSNDIQALNAFRSSAIAVLRAGVGSKGLRITQYEYAQMVHSLPSAYDTFDVAQQKLDNLKSLLDEHERGFVTNNWTTPDPNTTVRMTDGKRIFPVPAKDIAEARAAGATFVGKQ